MKRLLSLLIGLIVLHPTVVFAAEQPPSYVEQVLQRADEGIKHAWDPKDALGTYFANARLQWINIVLSTSLSLVDTGQQVVDQERDLPDRNACLHADLYLIERKMEDVQDQLQKAERQRQVTTIFDLQSVLGFLSESENNLAHGATDPTYSDDTWQQPRSFDPHPSTTGFCCVKTGDACNEETTSQQCADDGGAFSYTVNECTQNGCTLPPDQPMSCPFNTDYLPPNLQGYGCDMEAMTKLLTVLPNNDDRDATVRKDVQKELDGIKNVQMAAESYYSQAKAYDDIQRQIDSILDGKTPPPLPDTSGKRVHKQFVGCLTSVRCQSEGDVTCRALLANGQRSLRGPFSLEVDQSQVLQSFGQLRVQQATDRPPSDTTAITPDTSSIFIPLKEFDQQVFQNFSRNQAQAEALSFAVGSDPHLAIGDTLQPLRDSVQRLAGLIYGDDKKMGSLRGFVRDFAYFLRRSCLERPCNERLDRVLKIVFQDKCFPYTNGEYLTSKEADECKKAAELDAIKP